MPDREKEAGAGKYDYSVITEPIMEWFEKEKRDLPWRTSSPWGTGISKEGGSLAYYVWVSEIMLQQTRVEAVKEYFLRFIQALPDVQSLAEASEDRLLKLWEGLGYYNRARNLQKAAKRIVEEHGGRLPADYEALLGLPGIGSYTAGAIASQAFGLSEPAVDGNVLRVAKRLAGSFDDIAKASVKKELEQELKKAMPLLEPGSGRNSPGAYNQAWMELGAIVCIPNGKPLCQKCPVSQHCEAYQKGLTLLLPVKSSNKKRRKEEKTVLLLEYQGKYALHKRGEGGLLAKLWELPNVEGKLPIPKMEELLLKNGALEYEMGLLGEAKHIFSHVEWHMLGYKISIEKLAQKEGSLWDSLPGSITWPEWGGEPASDAAEEFSPARSQELVWVKKEQIDKEYAMPSAFRAYKPE